MRKLKSQKGFVYGRLCLAGLMIACCSVLPAFGAEYYTWVDENGVTNYAEHSPDGYQAEYITGSQRFGRRMPKRQAAPEKTAATEEPQSVAGEVDPEAVIAQERAKYEKLLNEEKAFNCNVGTQNLARLTSFGRIRIKDDNGTERVMTDQEMEDKKQESRNLIRENCKG